jgi:RNA polymerase sigma-70 factor (ECF subfamily)
MISKRAGSRMTYQSEAERELLDSARKGDNGAYEDLVRMYQRQVYAFLYRLSRNVEDAMELTQSTFVKAWISLGRFRGDSSFKTYIYRIAANAWRNTVRDRMRRKAVDLDSVSLISNQDPQRISETSQEHDMLWASVDRLPPRQKEVLVLRIREGFSFEETARIMGCTTGSAKASYHHAINKIKAALKVKDQ